MHKQKYVIISPVRNEEEYIEITIKSIIHQTILPTQWIIVNDGSKDRTLEIIEPYLIEYPWIKLINVADRGYYLPGKGVVETFYKGYDLIDFINWDFIVKLDCDLEFEPDYFKNLMAEFDKNPKLGIASGCTYIPKNESFIREDVMKDHPVGPSKVYKKQCWESMNGLKPVPGWDLADLLKAQMNGWETRCFYDLQIKHYRLTGSRRKGIWAPKHLQGRFEYRQGYNFYYTLLKALNNILLKPAIIGSIGKITGYIYAFLNKEEYLFEKEMRSFLRKKQKRLILSKLKLVSYN